MGNPTGFYLTAGQNCDLEGADILMENLQKAKMVLADKAYDVDERMRDKLAKSGCIAVIPWKANRINPLDYDEDVYKSRHLIENFYAKLKQYRGIATRYDKTACSFLGAIYLVAAVIWLN